MASSATPTSVPRPRMTLKNAVIASVTENDRETVDTAKFLWILGTFAYIVISIIYVWHSNQWNPLEWGSGYAAISGGSGAAMWLKNSSSPPGNTKIL